MSRRLRFLVSVLGEGVAEAVLFGGPAWLINHFFGPFHLPDRLVTGFAVAAGVGGLAMFAVIGVSRHPDAWKVRVFGAVIAGVLAAVALYRFIACKH